MIELKQGNLLDAQVEALVNAVNTAGVMGKGLALQFKKAYPEMFRDYVRVCKVGLLQIGVMHVYEQAHGAQPRYLINFPTKEQWRSPSKVAYIEKGLAALVSEVKQREIRSIAIPALGCGLGGLEWDEVYPLIQAAFAELPDVQVWLYPPQMNA
jgi:O-acetyl-ADP-ribose deacetylase (regulator of RNase III)